MQPRLSVGKLIEILGNVLAKVCHVLALVFLVLGLCIIRGVNIGSAESPKNYLLSVPFFLLAVLMFWLHTLFEGDKVNKDSKL